MNEKDESACTLVVRQARFFIVPISYIVANTETVYTVYELMGNCCVLDGEVVTVCGIR